MCVIVQRTLTCEKQNMKILVPVDGSPASVRAVQFAIKQVKAGVGDHLIIVNVQNRAMLGVTEGSALMPPSWLEKEEEKLAAEALQEAAAACREAGVTYATRSERGAIGTTIDRVTREEHADQIIMGTRGLGGVRGLLLGSVATQVLHLTDVPVTIVK
jgi:nucleotide-binding universal stress UspA family protein